jgi:putative nucleotidyltransferase with HDIG domain
MTLLSFREVSDIAEYQLLRWSPWKWFHCCRVSKIAAAFAKHIGLSVEDQRALFEAGILHDFGQLLCMNRDLDWKIKDFLTERDLLEIRSHPDEGYLLLLHFYNQPEVVELVRSHHCRLPLGIENEGNEHGYPPEFCKALEWQSKHWCLILADMFDAMVGERPYAQPLTPASALLMLRNDAAIGMLDREMVGQFCSWMNSR